MSFFGSGGDDHLGENENLMNCADEAVDFADFNGGDYGFNDDAPMYQSQEDNVEEFYGENF